MKQMYTYILRCRDGTYYVGVTNDIQTRILQHNQGLISGYTCERLPVLLVYYETFQSAVHAIAREKQLKGWSRKKKEALMNLDNELLHSLSECKNETHFKGE